MANGERYLNARRATWLPVVLELEIWMNDDGKYLYANLSCINITCYGVFENVFLLHETERTGMELI